MEATRFAVLGYSNPSAWIHSHHAFVKFRRCDTELMLYLIDSLYSDFITFAPSLGITHWFSCHASSASLRMNPFFSLCWFDETGQWRGRANGITRIPSYLSVSYGCSCCAWYHCHQPLCSSILLLNHSRSLPPLTGPNEGPIPVVLVHSGYIISPASRTISVIVTILRVHLILNN